MSPPLECWLQRQVRKGHVGSDFVELFWNAKALGKGFADVIKPTALGITDGFTAMNFSHFKDEHLILTHLYPANTYRIVAKGVKGERLVIFRAEDIETKPQGCHDTTQMPVPMHSSLPNDEDTSYIY
ncbi:hypothetical protein TSMEX_008145 [Taenia solium]|eukprot:TsM_001083500 transcript=TsM_001083500 gene=TsM_001083500